MESTRNKAVLVSLNVSIWTANKLDRDVSEEVADQKKLKEVVQAERKQLTPALRDALLRSFQHLICCGKQAGGITHRRVEPLRVELVPEVVVS